MDKQGCPFTFGHTVCVWANTLISRDVNLKEKTSAGQQEASYLLPSVCLPLFPQLLS